VGLRAASNEGGAASCERWTVSRFTCWVCGELLDTQTDHAVGISIELQRELRSLVSTSIAGSRMHMRCVEVCELRAAALPVVGDVGGVERSAPHA